MQTRIVTFVIDVMHLLLLFTLTFMPTLCNTDMFGMRWALFVSNHPPSSVEIQEVSLIERWYCYDLCRGCSIREKGVNDSPFLPRHFTSCIDDDALGRMFAGPPQYENQGLHIALKARIVDVR